MWAQARLAAGIGSDLMVEVYRRTLYQPYQFHTNVGSSALISTVTYDFGVAVAVIGGIMTLTTQGLVMVSITVGLIAYKPLIAVGVGALIALAYTVISELTRRRLVANAKFLSDKNIRLYKYLQESYGGIRDLILGGRQSFFVSLFNDTVRPIRQTNANNQVIQNTPRYILEAIGVLLLCSAAVFLVWSTGSMSGALPVVGALALASNRLLPAAQQMFLALSGMRSAHVSLGRILTSLDRPSDPVSLATPDRGVEFRHTVVHARHMVRLRRPARGRIQGGLGAEGPFARHSCQSHHRVGRCHGLRQEHDRRSLVGFAAAAARRDAVGRCADGRCDGRRVAAR